MATEEDVRRAALALPGVVERPSWGQPAWFAATLMARIWETGVLTVKSEEREALAGTDPGHLFLDAAPRSFAAAGSGAAGPD